MGCTESKVKPSQAAPGATSHDPYGAYSKGDPEFFYLLKDWSVIMNRETLVRQRLAAADLGSSVSPSTRHPPSYGTSGSGSHLTAPPRPPMRDGESLGSSTICSVMRRRDNAEQWVNSEFDDPIAHPDASKIGKLFCDHVRMDMVHRGWKGVVTYDVTGHPDSGIITVTISIRRLNPQLTPAAREAASVSAKSVDDSSTHSVVDHVITAHYHACID
jgi:hypothetical protein